MNTPSTVSEFARKRAFITSAQVVDAFGVSPASAVRLIGDAGEALLRLGAARATRYVATREVRGFGRHWPIHLVDEAGRLATAGTLHALHGDRWFVDAASPWQFLLQTGSDRGIFDGLPWYLDAMRPQGFMGRAYALHCAHLLGGLPADTQAWGDDDTLVGAIIAGDDISGNFLLGEPPAVRFGLYRPRIHTPWNDRASAYMAAAQRALEGEPVGSSAAGKQPKFGMALTMPDGSSQHMLVKFSPPTDTPSGQRWSDLLVCEHLANTCLRAAGVVTADTCIVQAADRTFLESVRFDRVGERGRRALTSLFPLATSLGCASTRWSDAADLLLAEQLLDEATHRRMVELQRFGNLIGNSDMHLGNLSLWLGQRAPFALAPLYDMLPMVYRPTSQGEIIDRGFRPAPDGHHWTIDAARAFWAAVASNDMVSEGFRAIASGHVRAFN